jgi:FixJ family two-component response regulator
VTKPIVVGVDDDVRVRESIESLVESAGYASLVFGSAEEFLQSGTLATASCLIADVRMPGMDGIKLQRRVRLERPRLPVIFISAHNDDDIRRRALDGGAVDFLYKPFDAADLLGAIDRALNEV